MCSFVDCNWSLWAIVFWRSLQTLWYMFMLCWASSIFLDLSSSCWSFWARRKDVYWKRTWFSSDRRWHLFFRSKISSFEAIDAGSKSAYLVISDDPSIYGLDEVDCTLTCVAFLSLPSINSIFSLFLSTIAKNYLFETSSCSLRTLFSKRTSSKSCICYLNLNWVWSSYLCIAVMVFSYPSISGFRTWNCSWSFSSLSSRGHPTGSLATSNWILSSSYYCSKLAGSILSYTFFFKILISDSFSLSFWFNLATRSLIPLLSSSNLFSLNDVKLLEPVDWTLVTNLALSFKSFTELPYLFKVFTF